MIESNIIEWLDFGESVQKIEAYSKKHLLKIFRLFRELLNNRLSLIFDIIFIIIYFIQLYCMTIFFVNYKNDILLEILNYLQNVFVLSNLFDNNNVFIIVFNLVNIILYLNIFLMIFISFTTKKHKYKLFAYIVNLINMIIFYYFIGPLIDISFKVFLCENGINKILQVKCYKNIKHIIYFICSILLFILYIFIASLYSFFFNRIGAITPNIKETIIRIDSKYELFILFLKIIIFCFNFIIRIRFNNYSAKVIYISLILIFSIIISIYNIKYVYYYNKSINYITYLGWFFSSWLSLCILLKYVLNLNRISSSIIIGWILIFIAVYKIDKIESISLLTETNVLEFKDLKSIEIFNNILLNMLSNKKDNSPKILLYGIIKNFVEYINNNPEISYHYQKLLNDYYLNKKFNDEFDLPLLAIIYIIYSIHLDKFSEEIAIYMSYFLINKLNNPTYAILLSSRIKVSGIRLYYKYLLTEDIREYLSNKLNNNKDSIKNVQIGSIILYYLYIDLLKLKIYDGITNQIDFFDILRNCITTKKSMPNFLQIGSNILKTRKEILKIWKKIIEINPFSDETYKDYMLYLETILQDDILVREETKNYTINLGNKASEKHSTYHNMFVTDTSSILLIDGYFTLGKILYASPNFSLLFTYNSKEILNFNIDDLLPNAIQPFHKELIEEAVKYSNMNYRFKRQIESLLKNKNGGLLNIKLYVKVVPNISYGLIYFAYLEKIKKSNLVIILDKDLRINGFTEKENSGSPFTMEAGYNLSHSLYGHHIGLIIPDILPLIEYKNEEFIIMKRDLELKGYLFQINIMREIKTKVENILNKIKNKNKNKKTNSNDNSMQYDDTFQIISEEFNELISELNKQKTKPFSMFYKVQMFSYLDDKYKYYKIIIIDDTITGNEGEQIIKKELEESKNNKNSDYIDYKTNNSKKTQDNNKEGKSKNIKIEKQILNSNINKNNDLLEKNENEINENIGKRKNSLVNKEEKNEKSKNKEKDNVKNNNKSNKELTIDSQFIKEDRGFNKIKLNIIKSKEGLQIKIIKVYNLIFAAITITFIICDYTIFKSNFKKIENIVSDNALFNMTKISIGVLYLMSSNIIWEIHNCFIPTEQANYSYFYELFIKSNIGYLLHFRNSSESFSPDFKRILEKKLNVYLSIYGGNHKEHYEYNLDNFLLYVINSGINILDSHSYLLNEGNKANEFNINNLSFGYNELLDLQNQTLYYFFSDLNGFNNNEIKKKIESISNFYPLICNTVFSLLLFVSYMITILTVHNIIIFFLERLINFNSVNLDNYLKNLDEIKKKIQNDNIIEEEEKDEIELNDSELKNSIKNEENEKKNLKQSKSLVHKKKKKSKKKVPNKDGKLMKQRKNKIKIMSAHLISNTLLLGIIIFFTLLLSSTYFIFSKLYENNTKQDFLDFDSVNNDIIGIFKESFEIFVKFKKELSEFEKTLIKCERLENKYYNLSLSDFGQMNIPTFKNSIIQIKSGFGFKGKILDNFTLLYSENACEALFGGTYLANWCGMYFGGLLFQGIEQTLSKINTMFLSLTEEFNYINENSTRFKDYINENHFFELYTQYIYQKAVIYSDEIFDALRIEKLEQIFLISKIVFVIYLILIFLFLLLLFYLIQTSHILVISSMNFIAIFPLKYLVEDEKLYNEIIIFGNKYFSL